MDKHTPTPWGMNSPQIFMGVTCIWIHGTTGPVLKIEGSRKEHVLEDAAFIVRAVNEYQSDKEEITRLKKIIQEGKQYWEGFSDGENETIAKAEGK